MVTVKIGKRTYVIKYQGRLAGDCWGICFHPTKKSNYKGLILIEKGQRQKNEFDTVLHEILHAICHEKKLELTDELEEEIVRNIANGLTDFFKDNPDFTEDLFLLLE